MNSPLPCRECGKLFTQKRCVLGLCWPCYRKPGVRAKYAKAHGNQYTREPTEEELEQIIAEQMRCLPHWWTEECEYQMTVYRIEK